jgi:hypothetical protein
VLVLGLVLGLGLLAPGRSAAQGSPPAPALIPVAQAYTAAWNAHDLAAVLACFAPDAIVRERWGAVPPDVWDTRDPRVARAYLDNAFAGEAYATHGFAWATGRPEIAAWAAARFAQRHRFATDQHHATGDTVAWRYQEFVDPFQRTPGFSPTEGSAEAVVRDGRITVLTLVQSPASVQRRRGQEAAALAAFATAAATGRAAPRGAGPSAPPPEAPRGDPPGEPSAVTWPLALGGLAALGAVAAALRRRRAPGTSSTWPGRRWR